MEKDVPPEDARQYALIALGVFLLAEVVTTAIWVLRHSVTWFKDIPAIPIVVVLFEWMLPFLIVYKLERRDFRSLGLWIRREKHVPYALYALAGIVLPGFIVGFDKSLLIEFVEQVVYIGLVEEFFNRGYVMGRLCAWLGNLQGLLLNGLLFGLSHIVSRLAQHGFRYPTHDLLLGLQTFAGGLLFGYLFLRARKNIVPPAVLHISTNMYLGRIIALFTA